MIILGIDPGSVRTGFGAIKKEGYKLIHLKSGILNMRGASKKNDRLVVLDKNINDLINALKPNRVGVEKVFFAKNQKTALEVAEARGVILAAIAKKSIPIIEITPTQTKIAVTGDGKASKKAVMAMTKRLLGVPDKLLDDVSDALAIAIAVANRYPEVVD